MSTDSEEVEKVLLSLVGEGTASFSSSAEGGDGDGDGDGDADRDKVEELLRQLEKEKEQETESESNVHVNEVNTLSDSADKNEAEDIPKPKPKPSGLKKPNGDKPAAPTRRKEPPGDDIPKPWKKKGAIRKKNDDEDFFVLSAKDPPPSLRSDVETQEQAPTAMDTDSTSQPSSVIPNGIHSNDIKSPPSSPSTSQLSHTPPKPERKTQVSSSSPSHAPASPAPTSPTSSLSSSIPTQSPPRDSSLSTTPTAPFTPPSVHVTTHAPPATPASTQPVPLPAATPIPSSSLSSSSSSPAASRVATPPPTSESIQKKGSPKQNADEILVDDLVKDETPVFSKQDFAGLRSQILKQVAEETAILAHEFHELKLKYDEEVRGKLRLKSVLVEYEKTIAKLIDDAGMSGHHEALADRVIELENENKRKGEEYEAISSAHSDIKSRYENAKADNEKLKSNDQVQKEAILRLQNELQASETRFNMLKSHAETKLDTASEQLVKLRDERAKEMALLQTRTQKAEARTQALEKENKELLLICDDLMSKLELKSTK